MKSFKRNFSQLPKLMGAVVFFAMLVLNFSRPFTGSSSEKEQEFTLSDLVATAKAQGESGQAKYRWQMESCIEYFPCPPLQPGGPFRYISYSGTRKYCYTGVADFTCTNGPCIMQAGGPPLICPNP